MSKNKFRVWVKSEQIMVDDIRLSGMLNLKLQQSNVVFLQYIGKTDIDGVAIVEGDILEWSGGRGEVIYENASFNVRGFFSSSQEYPCMAFSEFYQFKVLGNIYENKELLDDKG